MFDQSNGFAALNLINHNFRRLAGMAALSSPVELSAPAGTMKDVDLEEGGNDSGISDDVTAAETRPVT